MIATVRGIHVSGAVESYAVNITQATRHDRDLRLGASPRATIHLIRVAKARAALDGREFVLPDDIDALAVPVLSHRLVAARMSGSGSTAQQNSISEIIDRIVAAVPVPLAEPSRTQ
jgi:MoxR-like ATPase